jgi:hypothetical protein
MSNVLALSMRAIYRYRVIRMGAQRAEWRSGGGAANAKVLLLALIACGGAESLRGVGVSQGGAGAPAMSANQSRQDVPLQAKLPQGLRPMGKPFISVGHAGGRFVAELETNTVAEAALQSGVRSFPAGSLLLMRHNERPAEGGADKAPEGEAIHPPNGVQKPRRETGPTLWMEKRSDGLTAKWVYFALDSRGVQVEANETERCSYCHRDAPTDHVFPSPAFVQPSKPLSATPPAPAPTAAAAPTTTAP